MFSPQWQDARSVLLDRLGRTPTVGEVFEFLRESSQAGKLAHRDFVENHDFAELSLVEKLGPAPTVGRVAEFSG